jgi:hypothetical protein
MGSSTRVLIANRGQAGFRQRAPPNRSCALLRYRPDGAAPFSAERPICLSRSSPAPRLRIQKASGVIIANGYLRSDREEWIRGRREALCGGAPEGAQCPDAPAFSGEEADQATNACPPTLGGTIRPRPHRSDAHTPARPNAARTPGAADRRRDAQPSRQSRSSSPDTSPSRGTGAARGVRRA